MRFSSLVFSSLALAQGSVAGVIQARQDTETTSATTSEATAGLVQTTVDGKPTTLQVAVPTGDATDAETSTAALSETKTALGAVPTNIGTGSAALLTCNAPAGNPFCLPSNGTSVVVSDTYYVTWDPSRFEVNTTITILLNYANDTANGNRVAWTSEGTPREKGFVTIKMDNSWLMGTRNATLDFALIAYQPVSDSTAQPMDGPTVFLSKSSTHWPPPPPTKLPDNLSLYVGVPVGVGGLLFVLLGLYFGMRKTRKIDVKNVMGRRKGYGTRKSKRERLGQKKGAIRLEEREITDPGVEYKDAQADASRREDRAMPPTQRRDTEESLGSLVSDNHGNAFRDEIEKQNTGRRGMF